MGYLTDQFNRGRADEIRKVLEDLAPESSNPLSQKINDIFLGTIRKGIKKMSGAGGLPGAIVGFVVDKIIGAVSGDLKKLPKGVAFLPSKEQDKVIKQHMEHGVNEAMKGFYKDLASDVSSFASEHGMSPEEAKTVLLDEAKNNPGDFLTGQGVFDRSADIPEWAQDWGGDMMFKDATGDAPLNKLFSNMKYSRDWKKAFKGPQWDDVDVDEIDFDEFYHQQDIDEGNVGLGDNSIMGAFNKLFGEKQATVHPEDLVSIGGEDWVKGPIQDRNIIGNLISRKNPTRYIDGDLFSKVMPQDIIDFDVEDPEGYQEILDLIESMGLED